MKFEAHYYSETGNMGSTEYSDNLYSLLRNYSVFWQNDKYKPTPWITEGNVSLRIHDFAFKELTPETYCAYLQERILEADRLLSEIDFASPDELYTNRPDKLEKAVYSLLKKKKKFCLYFVQLRIAKVKQTTTDGIDSTCSQLRHREPHSRSGSSCSSAVEHCLVDSVTVNENGVRYIAYACDIL